MTLLSLRRLVPALGLSFGLTLAAHAAEDGFAHAVALQHSYNVEANVTYLSVSGRDLKLDIYQPKGAAASVPVLLKIHGGGWVAGNREGSAPSVLPYLQMGFAVVNIEYRLAKTALAPAAVEDALCALHWIGRNATHYKFDLNKVVVTGNSAGGHLALTTGMIGADSPFAHQCAPGSNTWTGPFANTPPKVAAVINWYGITDVADMLQGANTRAYAMGWFGSMPDRMALARSISPLTHVRAGGPAVLTIHGDADQIVPYAHALKLQTALAKAGVKHELVTIKGGGHGLFSLEQDMQAFQAIRTFLRERGIAPQ